MLETVAVARHAMASRFEIVLHGDRPVSLRAAGEAALDEIERLEAQLSLYRPTSQLAHINARAAGEPVRVEPRFFRVLQLAQKLSRETQGAFDITVAPLVRCWGFMGGKGGMPHPDAVAEARAKVGMDHLLLDEGNLTVRFARAGVMLDLGAIGKGYAIDRAAELLRDAGITSAIIHGGTSTVYALGKPPDADAWKIAIEAPRSEHTQPSPSLLAMVPLHEEAMSVSAVWGKAFQSGGKTFGHVIDPRTGEPAGNAVLSAVVLPSATETDALSTALLTLGPDGHNLIARLRPGMRTLVVAEDEARGVHTVSQGIVKAEHPTSNIHRTSN